MKGGEGLACDRGRGSEDNRKGFVKGTMKGREELAGG